MTIVASILFLAALVASVVAIAVTMGNAMPRIREVIEVEFGPEISVERRITFGPVHYLRAAQPARVVAFPLAVRVAREFRLAA